MLEIKAVQMEFPADTNIIVGQAHFIKTVEDLYEAMSTTVPQARFGIAFNESSGACLTRAEGNDPGLQDCAVRNAQALGAGHFQVGVRQPVPRQSILCAPVCRGKITKYGISGVFRVGSAELPVQLRLAGGEGRILDQVYSGWKAGTPVVSTASRGL
jgi:hypothetical protein